MPQFVNNEAAVARATRLKTAWATSKLRLVQSPAIPDQNWTKAQLVAAEATFNNYTAGGYAITAFTGPQKVSGGGQIITGPTISPTVDNGEDPPVTNTITAWWLEASGGGVEMIGVLEVPVPMQNDGDGFTIVVQDVEGKNPTPTPV